MNWFYTSNNHQKGPVTAEQLTALIRSGDVKGDDLVWKVGMSDWTPASRIAELNPSATPSAVDSDFASSSPTTTAVTPSPNYGTPAPAGYQPSNAAAPNSNNGMSIASFVCGIVGLVICCIPPIIPVIAIVLGFIALNQISQSQNRIGGRGFAKSGIILGIIGIITYILLSYFGTKFAPDLLKWSEKMQRENLQKMENQNKGKPF